MQSKPRRELADEMNRRRAQLRLNWDQVASRAGISIATLRRLRNSDDPVSLDTMIGIDTALEWEAGHVEARLKTARRPRPTKTDGKNGTPRSAAASDEPPVESERDRLVRELLALRARVQEVIDRIDEIDEAEGKPASA